MGKLYLIVLAAMIVSFLIYNQLQPNVEAKSSNCPEIHSQGDSGLMGFAAGAIISNTMPRPNFGR